MIAKESCARFKRVIPTRVIRYKLNRGKDYAVLRTGLLAASCGFKVFRTKFMRPILETAQIDRFGFDVELLFVSHRAGLRLKEVPVRWDHCEGSQINVMRDSWRMFNEVREVRSNMRVRVYEEAIKEIDLLKCCFRLLLRPNTGRNIFRR